MTSIRQKHLRQTALAASLLLLAIGCDDSDEKVFKSPGNIETKPNATLAATLKESNGLGGANAAPTVAASMTFVLDIRTETEVAICNGEFTGQLLSNFSLKLPEAEVQCLGLVLDIASLLNGGTAAGIDLGGGLGSGSGSADTIVSDGYVLSFKKFLGADFDPPRPFLLGPIVQNPDKYKGYKKSFPTTLRGKSAEGEPIEKRGTFHVEVTNHHTSYSNAAIKDNPDKLDSIIKWKMTAEGFEGVPANVGLPVQSMEFEYNTRPLMLPHIIIKGRLADGFLKGDAATLKKAVGVVIVELIVSKYSLNN